ncbi:MAG TPA: ABC-2 transporter permease [Clostridia bacterium]|nr:ABC-2 transporter permease [Clostridia bacterium]
MLALLYKDWSIIKKTRALYFSLFYFFIIIPAMQNGSFLPRNYSTDFFFIFVVYLLFSYLAAYDYKYNGHVFIPAFPVTKKKIVEARYIFASITFLSCLVILQIIKAAILLIGKQQLTLHGMINYEQTGVLFLIFGLFFGVILPVYYKLGYQKTRWFMFIAMIIAIVIPSIITSAGSSLDSPIFLLLSVLAVLLFFSVSIKISVKFVNSVNM